MLKQMVADLHNSDINSGFSILRSYYKTDIYEWS